MKNKPPLISIIVPVYNVEPYLKKCVQSIQYQTYENLEIILVNDGSPDNCGKMCDAFAAIDNRIKVVHQENQGLSRARNVGLALASGEYIAFIDSDDYIEKDTFETVIKGIIKNDYPDLLFFREKSVDTNGKTIYINGQTPTGEILKKDVRFAENRIIGELINGPCDKVYKANVLSGIFFKEGKIHGEDFVFNLEMLKKIKTVVFIDQIKYSYVSNPNSITHKSFNENSFDQIYCKDLVVDIVKKDFPDYIKICEKRAFTARLNICRQIYYENLQKNHEDKIKEFNLYMKVNYDAIKEIMSFKEKLEYLLYSYCKPLYKLFINIIYKLRK